MGERLLRWLWAEPGTARLGTVPRTPAHMSWPRGTSTNGRNARSGLTVMHAQCMANESYRMGEGLPRWFFAGQGAAMFGKVPCAPAAGSRRSSNSSVLAHTLPPEAVLVNDGTGLGVPRTLGNEEAGRPCCWTEREQQGYRNRQPTNERVGQNS